MTKVGFVGLGHMGLPMASNLLKAGYTVYGYDIQPSALKAFEEEGGQICHDVADLAKDKDVLITMLQTGEQVKQACFGNQGVFQHAKPHALFIDCSSIDVQSSRDIHQAAIEKGLLVIDAPVSGGVAGAKAATLTFMVGGKKETYQRAESILSVMGKNIIYTGGPGSGQAAKICNNMILGVSMIAVSEAFVLAEKLGLSPEKLFEVVNKSSGQCWVMSTYPPVPGLLEHVPANNDYQPGFTAQMMLKDLNTSQEVAMSVQANTSLSEKARTLYESFVEQGLGHLDFSAIIKTIQ